MATIHSASKQTDNDILCLMADIQPGQVLGIEVIADDSGKFCGNGREFTDPTEAIKYADDLWSRWTLVREFRIVLKPARQQLASV